VRRVEVAAIKAAVPSPARSPRVLPVDHNPKVPIAVYHVRYFFGTTLNMTLLLAGHHEGNAHLMTVDELNTLGRLLMKWSV
jgi:hypothetical protein